MKQAVFSEMLQPVQVVCDVSGGGQVVVLNHQIPHSVMTDLDTQSLPKLSVQSCSTEDQLPHGKGELLIDLKESYHAFSYHLFFPFEVYV